jgi:hypothetical protein
MQDLEVYTRKSSGLSRFWWAAPRHDRGQVSAGEVASQVSEVTAMLTKMTLSAIRCHSPFKPVGAGSSQITTIAAHVMNSLTGAAHRRTARIARGKSRKQVAK